MSYGIMTILKTEGGRVATKTIGIQDGNLAIKTGYSAGSVFIPNIVEIESLEELSTILRDIETDQRKFIVRGQVAPELEGTQIRRNRHYLQAASRRWLCIDIDRVAIPDELSNAECSNFDLVSYAISRLPQEFHKADCYYQFSSSMGVVPGLIKLHLWFMLSRPLDDQEVKAWLSGSAADLSLYDPTKPIFTARPVLEDGVDDPVPQRSGLHEAGYGIEEVVPPECLDYPHRRPGQPVSNVPSQQVPFTVRYDDAGMVIDGRDYWLYLRSCEASNRLYRERGGYRTGSISREEVANLTWKLFESTARPDRGDGRCWTYWHALERASHRIRELEQGWNPTARNDAVRLFPGIEPAFELETVSLEEGERHLQEGLDRFFEAVAKGDRPQLAVRITMGVGKTRFTLERLVELLRDDPALNVAIYTPRHDLGSAIVRKLRDDGLAVPVRQVRGRQQHDDDGTPMCLKADYTRFLAEKGLPVRPNACYRDVDQHCEHLATCRYWQQFSSHGQGGVWVYPHAYLGLPANEQVPEPDLVIIDEGFITSLHETTQLPLSAVMQRLSEVEGQAGFRVCEAAMQGLPMLAHLREAGITPEALRNVHTQYGNELTNFAAEDGVNLRRLGEVSLASERAVRMLAVVLAEEMETHPERDVACRVRYNPTNQNLVVDRLADLPFSADTPVLLLDATADQSLLDTIFPAISLLRIDVEQPCRVTQVYNRSGSNSSWDNREENVAALVTLLRSRTANGDRILCVSHKALAERLAAEAIHENLEVANFNGVRGSNAYEHCTTAVITGRNQPKPQDVDGLARAIWWRHPEPLRHDSAAKFGADAADDLPHPPRGYWMAEEGEAWGVMTRRFTDDRIEAVHYQLREAETAQAIARLRLVRPGEVKEVFLLGNLPVEVHVNRLIRWEELMPSRLERVFEEKRVLPLTGRWLHAIAPEEFQTPQAAACCLSRERGELAFRYRSAAQRESIGLVRFRVPDGDGRRAQPSYALMPDAVPVRNLGRLASLLRERLRLADGRRELEIQAVEAFEQA